MIDNSIIQLLEASKTVNIFMRNVEVEATDAVRRGHFDCTCTAPPMSGNRSYLTTKLRFMARDGCDFVVGFVWSPDDRSWRNATTDTLEQHIMRGTGMLREWDATHPVAQQILGGDSIYVRLVQTMHGEVEHVNRRVAFDDVVEEFIDGDPGHRIERIQVATTTNAHLPAGSYLDPTISMPMLLSWLDGARLNAHAFVATPNAARQLERAGLLTNRMTNKIVKLEVGAPPREGDATDIPEADVIADAIRRQRRRVIEQRHHTRPDDLGRHITAIYDPDLDEYDEDDDI